jgi:hypothetical protein
MSLSVLVTARQLREMGFVYRAPGDVFNCPARKRIQLTRLFGNAQNRSARSGSSDETRQPVPNALSDLFAGDSLTGALRQHDEQGELFRLESHAAPAIGSVELEIVETDEARWRVQRGHVQQDLRKYMV